MKKKALILLVSLAMMLLSVVSAFAVDEEATESIDIPPIEIPTISEETEADTDIPQIEIPTVSEEIEEVGQHYMVDDAGLLATFERQTVELFLQGISERQEFDVVVVTVDSTELKTPEEFADDYYDYNGYGQGENKDGCLLLVSMEDRDWHISTTGFGITALTDAGLERISEEFVDYLSSGEYESAFMTFGEQVDQYVTQAKTGEPYDYNNLPKQERHFQIGFLVIGLITGLVAAAVITNFFVGKMKSVRHNNEAGEYLLGGSFALTGARDTFIRTNVVRTPIDHDSSGHGGSTVHTSSSGTDHGGAGGSF